ncbi:MAG: hypothetical protein JWR43_1967, partial [Phenylobacterium sp.]|nr:hypothetical protein [Phenylobacterium sp.]
DVAAAGKASADVATAIASDRRPPDPNPALDSLVRVTADALRSSDQRDFRAAAELCDRARPGGAEALAACLDIAPVVRRAIARLPEWVAHPTGDTNAAARLAYKDSVAIAEDAGPRFFEMLAGQLTPPWMVLRIISAVMDKPTERYLADSELGGFPERVMNAVDEELRAIGGMDLDAGPEAGRAAGRLVELITQQVFELEVCIELTRDTGWGRRIVGQKQSLANLVEARLRDADKLSTAALPLQSSGFSRPRRTGPKLESPPDAKVVGRVMTLLHFAHEIRRCANYGGFSAAHAKAMEKIGGMIDHYVDEVFDQVRTGDVEDLKIAHAYLRAAADFNGLVRDDKAAELLRRRSAAACEADSPQPLKPKAG